MGSHAVMLLSTVALESLIVLKWSSGKFPQPASRSVKVFWACFLSVLVIYPLIRFGKGKETSSDRLELGKCHQHLLLLILTQI